jgi:hypothetical protein
MLMGFKDNMFEFGSIDQWQLFISALVLHRNTKFIFEFIGIYVPVNHARTSEFLQELETKVSNSQQPVVVVGEFNLIRGARDKSNANINWPRFHLFNDCIARLANLSAVALGLLGLISRLIQ